jgi:TM2 domain-containing membrane protein YozV
VETRENAVRDGLLVGLIAPGIAQGIAQRPGEGVVWLVAAIYAWLTFGPWALLVHALSASRTGAIAAKAWDTVAASRPPS